MGQTELNRDSNLTFYLVNCFSCGPGLVGGGELLKGGHMEGDGDEGWRGAAGTINNPISAACGGEI